MTSAATLVAVYSHALGAEAPNVSLTLPDLRQRRILETPDSASYEQQKGAAEAAPFHLAIRKINF